MNVYLFLLFFLFVTLSHAFWLIFAKKNIRRSASSRRKVWLAHYWINGSLWLFVIVWIIVLQFTIPRTYLNNLKYLGIFFIFSGTFLAFRSFLNLGLNQAMGLRFFFPDKARKVSKGLYKFLNNPMYDGFISVFLGLSLTLGIKEDFYIALASFLFFNIFLASIENYKFSLNPF